MSIVSNAKTESMNYSWKHVGRIVLGGRIGGLVFTTSDGSLLPPDWMAPRSGVEDVAAHAHHPRKIRLFFSFTSFYLLTYSNSIGSSSKDVIFFACLEHSPVDIISIINVPRHLICFIHSFSRSIELRLLKRFNTVNPSCKFSNTRSQNLNESQNDNKLFKKKKK